jgi:hypothetical protein
VFSLAQNPSRQKKSFPFHEPNSGAAHVGEIRIIAVTFINNLNNSRLMSLISGDFVDDFSHSWATAMGNVLSKFTEICGGIEMLVTKW